MSKLKPGTIVPSLQEDAATAAGIAADEDAAELDGLVQRSGTGK